MDTADIGRSHPDISYMLCFTTSFLFSLMLLNWIFKFQRIMRWNYEYHWVLLIAVCLLLLNVLVLKYEVSYKAISLGPICALVYIFTRENEEYNEAEINKAQKDNESIGAFWAHQAYDAYYSIVLFDLNDRMTLYEKENNITFLVKKLVLVAPLSCNTKNVLTERDELIKDIGHLPTIKCDQGANVNREYKNPVYRISSNKDLYISAEYPSPLTTLYRIKAFTAKEKWIYHRDCFIKTLISLVDGSPCIVAVFNDLIENPEPLSRFLLSLLKEEKKMISLSIE